MNELSVIQKAYDLVTWYIPILNRLPRNHKFALGDRVVTGLYDLLEGLVAARYARERVGRLESLNGKLDVLRYQSRLLLDFQLIEAKRYQYAARLINEIGVELGGWLKQQKQRPA